MKPQILFEDAEILVCHKPAGTAVQTAFFCPGHGEYPEKSSCIGNAKKETVKGPKPVRLILL